MLDTEQDKFIIAVWIPCVCHYATYMWEIDDEPFDKKGDIACMSMDEIETGRQAGYRVAIGYLGEGE
jgi:hypothetical protein